jgi:CRP/FNR family transcriptional regulator, cyclic AMP receptor protein
MPSVGDMEAREASLSSALAVIFRGKLCDVVLRNRPITTFKKDQVLYNVGDKDQTLFFLRSGFVKVGTITLDGHELIYDVRKGGDVVGELCASENPRQDRAVALEQTEAIAVLFDEVLQIVQQNRELLRQLVQVFCNSLSDAYDQLNSLAFSDTVHRLIRVLVRLGTQVGRTSAHRTELSTYLTQEEISQMVAVRRERVSTAMNFLRNRGMLEYSQHGYLTLDLKALQNYDD